MFRNLLMAQQKIRTFTVIFDSAGGNSISSQTVKQGKKAVFVTPNRSGYRFTGWYLEGDAFDFDTPVTRDITLVATWVRELFTQSGTAAIVPLGQKADRVDYGVRVAFSPVFVSVPTVIVDGEAAPNDKYINSSPEISFLSYVNEKEVAQTTGFVIGDGIFIGKIGGTVEWSATGYYV